MLPEGPVINDDERQETWGSPAAPDVTYSAAPTSPFPLPLFLPFAATYDLDIVLMTKHPEWDMHEYARLQTPDGPVWIAKDARASNGDQLIVADIPTLHSWLPEIPLPRKKAPLKVVDDSTGDHLDLRFEYENHDGEQVVATFEGPAPIGDPESKRNGSTMGHSRNQVLAVLDLSHQKFADSASVTYDGKDYGLEKVAGLVKMKLALQQTQGGIAEGRYTLLAGAGEATVECPGEPRFRTRHEMAETSGKSTTELPWHVERTDDRVVLRQCSELRTLRYDFLSDGDSLAMTQASVVDWQGNTTFRVTFAPALPDARRRFEGTVESRFVMDVGRQENHAIGTVASTWTDKGFVADWTSEKPWWVAERCVKSLVNEDRLETTVWPCSDKE